MGEVSPQPAGEAASCVTVIGWLGAGETACSCAHRFLNRNHLGPALPGLPSRPFRSDFQQLPPAVSLGTPHPPGARTACSLGMFPRPGLGGPRPCWRSPQPHTPHSPVPAPTRACAQPCLQPGMVYASHPSPVLRAHLSGATSLSIGPAPESDLVVCPDQLPPWPPGLYLGCQGGLLAPTHPGRTIASQAKTPLSVLGLLAGGSLETLPHFLMGALGEEWPNWDVLRELERDPRNRVRVLCDHADPLVLEPPPHWTLSKEGARSLTGTNKDTH